MSQFKLGKKNETTQIDVCLFALVCNGSRSVPEIAGQNGKQETIIHRKHVVFNCMRVCVCVSGSVLFKIKTSSL